MKRIDLLQLTKMLIILVIYNVEGIWGVIAYRGNKMGIVFQHELKLINSLDFEKNGIYDFI